MQSDNVDFFENPFSELQKQALKTAWMLIKPQIHKHGLNIFSRFYDKYPPYLQHFSDNRSLHEHTTKALDIFTKLIEDGLEDFGYFKCITSQVSQHHQRVLNQLDIIKVNEIIREYFCEFLAKNMTKTLKEAIDILLLCIESTHSREE